MRSVKGRLSFLLDLTGLGITTVGLDAGLHFDHNHDGLKEGTGWAGVGTGLLMLDRDGNGNTQLRSATLELADGSTRTIAEYDLARNGQDTVAASRQSIDADIRLLPDLDGMGGAFDLHQAMQKNPWLVEAANEPTWCLAA